jgi:hypothetical protein
MRNVFCSRTRRAVWHAGRLLSTGGVLDDDGLVHIEGDDLSLVRWNHRPALVRAALERFGGRADWKPRWYLLAVPTEAFMGSARSVFSLAALDERRECCVIRTTNPDHLVPSAPSPTNAGSLRIAARYAASRHPYQG